MNIRFDNKVVLVTGGSSGIGKSTALEFSRSGAIVAVNYHTREKEANDIVKEIQNSGGKALAVKADVTVKGEIVKMVSEVIKEFGRIDVLINNAGSLINRAGIEEMDEDLLDKVIDLNLKSLFMVTQAVLPVMRKQESGKIINISSIAGRIGGTPRAGHYAAAKGAVIALTKNMAKEFAPLGILVNAVAPGVIDTPFHDGVNTPEARAKFRDLIPLKRDGRPEEVAWPIVFLASEYASFITGETLEINGGQLMD